MNTPITVDVLANDVDPGGLSLELVSAAATTGTAVVDVDDTVLYTPAPDFVGTDNVSYVVRNTSGAQAVGSLVVQVDALPVPVNDTLPSFTGVLLVGQTLNASPGTWNVPGLTGFSLEFQYQWANGGADIAGSTAQTHLLGAAELGGSLSVKVRARTVLGGTSDWSGWVESAAQNMPNVPDPFADTDWQASAGAAADEIDVNWSALPPLNGGTFVRVEAELDGNGTGIDLGQTAPNVLSGVSPGQHPVRLRVVTNVGAGSWSAARNVTLEAAQTPVLSVLAVTQAPDQADLLFDYTVDMDGDFSWGIGEAANFPGVDPAAEAAAFRAGVGLDDFGGGLTLVTSGAQPSVSLTDDLGPLTGRTLMMLPDGSDAIVFATGAVPFTFDTTTPSAAISVEHAATFLINNGAGNETVTITGAAEDDITIILRAPLYYYSTPPAVVTSGYAQNLNDAPGGHQTRTTIDYKVQGASPDVSVEIADGGGDASDDQAGVMLNIRGVDPASPFRVAPGTPATATSTNTITPPAVTGIQAGDLVVCVISYRGDETGTVTPPAGYSVPSQADTGALIGAHDQAVAVFHKLADGTSETPGAAIVGITSSHLTAHTFVLGAA